MERKVIMSKKNLQKLIFIVIFALYGIFMNGEGSRAASLCSCKEVPMVMSPKSYYCVTSNGKNNIACYIFMSQCKNKGLTKCEGKSTEETNALKTYCSQCAGSGE